METRESRRPNDADDQALEIAASELFCSIIQEEASRRIMSHLRSEFGYQPIDAANSGSHSPSTPPSLCIEESSCSQQQANQNQLNDSGRRQLFPEKLWDLVNQPGSGIKWSPEGTKIEVERTQLEKFIGTKFRSQNFDSFIRQLHFYGFRKTGNSYHHDSFQRGHPEALLSMKRKYSSTGDTSSSTIQHQQQNTHRPQRLPRNASYNNNNNHGSRNAINSRSHSPQYAASNSSSCSNDSQATIVSKNLNRSVGPITQAPNKTSRQCFEQDAQQQPNSQSFMDGVLDLSSANYKDTSLSLNRRQYLESPDPSSEASCDDSDDQDYVALDCSKKSRRVSNKNLKSNKSTTKRLKRQLVEKVTPTEEMEQQDEVESRSTITKSVNKIPVYTLAPSEQPERGNRSAGRPTSPSYTTIREDLTEVTRQNNLIKITIPDLVKSSASGTNSKTAWPKTLVLKSCFNGGQNILSAYFIYKTSEISQQ